MFTVLLGLQLWLDDIYLVGYDVKFWLRFFSLFNFICSIVIVRIVSWLIYALFYPSESKPPGESLLLLIGPRKKVGRRMLCLLLHAVVLFMQATMKKEWWLLVAAMVVQHQPQSTALLCFGLWQQMPLSELPFASMGSSMISLNII